MRRIRKGTQRKWITLAIFAGIVLIWAICSTTNVLNREDKFLPLTKAYAQEAAEPAPTVQNTPTHVDSGVKFDLSEIF